MVLHAMAQTKTSKRKKPARTRSVLTLVANEAKRKKLLDTLEGTDWSLTATAEALDMSVQAVSSTLQKLDRKAYEKAVEDGRSSHGNRTRKSE